MKKSKPGQKEFSKSDEDALQKAEKKSSSKSKDKLLSDKKKVLHNDLSNSVNTEKENLNKDDKSALEEESDKREENDPEVSKISKEEKSSGVLSYLSSVLFEKEENVFDEESESVERKGLLSYLFNPPQSDEDDGSFSFSKLKFRYKSYKKKEKQDVVNRSVYREIVNTSKSTPEYWVLVFFSCIIATFGLLQNSSATIIGAMIIAPLMGPIMGLSLGTVWGDFRLFLKTLKVIIASTVISVVLALIMAYMTPVLEIPTEVLSRSLPRLFDLGVALACGFVGAYAITSKSIASAVPGVAISVALMPPLCSAGIGIGTGRFDIAGGSFLLFLTNLFGISFSACIVFWFKEVHPGDEDAKEIKTRVSRHIRVTAALLLLTAIPLAYFSYDVHTRTLQKIQVKEKIEASIPARFLSKYSILPSSKLTGSDKKAFQEGIILSIETYSPYVVKAKNILKLKASLKKILKRNVQIQITRLQTEIRVF